MNVVLDHQPNCIVALDIELPADRVNKEREAVAKEFQKEARIPGFRPGKAPLAKIEVRFAKSIDQEVKGNLVRAAVNEAVKSHNLRFLFLDKIEEMEIAADRSFRTRVKIVQEPDFVLPEYLGLTLEVAKPTVEETAIQNMMDYFRDSHATFAPATDRSLAMGDYAVLTYEGSLDGQPLAEAVPGTPPQLAGRTNGWVLMSEGTLLPGFSEALQGMTIGEDREIRLEVPESFPLEALRNKSVAYRVNLVGINTRQLPEWTDELAGRIEEGLTVEGLREKIRQRLAESAEREYDKACKNAIVGKLLDSVQCDLPEREIASATQSIVHDIVSESQARGVPDDQLTSHTDEIYDSASRNARDRVRANFILLRISQQEKISVDESDLYNAIYNIAAQAKKPPKQVVRDLQANGGIARLQDQIRIGKALEFLASKTTFTTPAAQPAA